tara:strand:- start:6 stop:479 length:474 start_codon:yes stop_codon:yes gene_type:complete
MNVYFYNPNTFVFEGIEETYADPVQPHKWVKPQYATFTAVPTIPSGKQARFVAASDNWVLEDVIAPASSASASTTEFQNMTYQERLNHYGLGGLQDHISTLNTVPSAAAVQSQIDALQALITNLQTDVNALNTMKGVYGASNTMDDVDTRLTNLEGS